MGAIPYAAPGAFHGGAVPQRWKPLTQRRRYGDMVLVAFLLAQCFDGVFTYVGVLTFGVGIEGNPIIVALIHRFGDGPALLGAKIVAAVFGIGLHLRELHTAIALLTAFYMVVAILPWMLVLFVLDG